MRAWRALPAAVLVSSGLFIGLASAPSSAVPGPAALVCSGGAIAAGTYSSITVTGRCFTPSGTITDTGNLTVKSFALLADVTPTPNALPATIKVTGNVVVNAYGILLLGCGPHSGCATPTAGTIGGSLTSVGGSALIVHNETIGGLVKWDTAGGGRTCDPAKQFNGTGGAGNPLYLDLEDSTVAGNVTVVNSASCWLGVERNNIGGSMSIIRNVMADPDANEILDNHVTGNLACNGNVPAVQFGDSAMHLPNQVHGTAKGECVAPISVHV
jgi:hypothetical protein